MGDIPRNNHLVIDPGYKAQKDEINHEIRDGLQIQSKPTIYILNMFTGGSHKKIVIVKVVEPDANKMDGQYFEIRNTFKNIIHKRL